MEQEDQSIGSITIAFRQLRAGDRDAARELWERLLPRLTGLARKALAGWPQRVADADDVVQNTFLGFVENVESGGLTGDLHRDELWRVLSTIAVRKALNQTRDERALKRGGGQVRELGEHDPVALQQLRSGLTVPEFDILVDELLSQLDDELRVFAILKLGSFSTAEIAEYLEVAERTVERKLKLIARHWHETLLDTP